MSSKESRRRSNRRSNRKQKYSTTTSSVGTDDESNGSSSSDDDQHYKYRKGEYIKEYKVKRHIFDGTFGRVLKVKRRNSKTYAMKIVRRNHVESAQSEADVLFHLKRKGLSRSFVELYECFHHRGYYCMVFERLGPSLYELMKFYKNHGIPMTLIKSISKQLLKYIGQLHDLKIVHTDLKPENILFSKNYKFKKGQNDLYLPQDDRIKIIDLGGAVFDNEGHDCIINTRQYRAPEVQLQCSEWNHKSDVWGIGCIIAEMYIGQLLFQTRKNEQEHMALVEKITDQNFPYWMASNVKGSLKQYFTRNSTNGKYYIWPQEHTTKESIAKVENQKPLKELILDPLLRDLLQKMLEIDPDKRISCHEALRHKFFCHRQ
ncbi:unnamed protein product [Paramecium primaurelia]|uniref:Protein kinase domain-containing protein n=1 Tax=Paramecium primaurelia TaxID=5886 RepID=A0A8S1JS33_PARPR|nr:unnamed protein product [Paramecium primaurelia]